ncbi:hypothetical protein ACQY0O_005260 [Thecaphora frezii]
MSTPETPTPMSRMVRPSSAQQHHTPVEHHTPTLRDPAQSDDTPTATPTKGFRTPTVDSTLASSPPASSYAGSKTGTSPSFASSSNWKASVELSLRTKRRLIRKPLPLLPGEGGPPDSGGAGGYDGTSSSRKVDEELRSAEEWWPTSLPERHQASAPTAQSFLFPSRDRPQNELGLDDQSTEHLLSILHYAALRPPDRTPSSMDVEPAKPARYVVEEDLLDSLFAAVDEALNFLSKREVLGSLQRTASIRWRAEAQLRNAAAAGANQADASQASSSKWARFAWPAAALGRAYREAQRGTLPPLPNDAAGYDANGGDGLHPFGGDPRIRKRDVAIKILSNAVWFVRNYGPAAGVETMYGRPTALSDPLTSTSEVEGDKGRGDDGTDAGNAKPPPRPTGLASRRVSENLMMINGGKPNFLSKSTPTTALSGTATPEPNAEAGSPMPAPAPAVMTAADQLSEAQTAAAVAPAGAGADDKPVRETAMVDASEPAAAPSKAMEHLASLNAASGASLRAKAQALQKSEGNGGDAFADGISQRLAHQTSRPSLRSNTSYRTEAEATETAMLEKAEREYLAMVGQGCDEWAKMVLCRLCASFEVADEGKDTLKARNSQQGKALADQLRQDEPPTTSSISTRSDATAKAARAAAIDEGRPIVWMPDVFEGTDLFFGGGDVGMSQGCRNRQDHDQRVKVVGGSFLIKARDGREKKALSDLLELMVFAGCSMLLEAGFLRDSDAARPKLLRVPVRVASTTPQPSEPGHRRNLSARSARQASGGEAEEGPDFGAAKTSSSPSSPSAPSGHHASSRRWTKSLWGMLQAKAHASSTVGSSRSRVDLVDAEPESPAAVQDVETAGRSAPDGTSLELARTASGDHNAEPHRPCTGGSTGLPRSKTVSHHESRSSISSITSSIGAAFGASNSRDHLDSLSSRANAKLGRLIGVFGRALPDAAAAAHGDSDAEAHRAGARERRASVPSQPKSTTPTATLKRDGATPTFQPVAVAKFPPSNPGPSPLTCSPELAMLSFYQLPDAPSDSRTYLSTFMRLQSIGFLCDERTEGVTFATPSNGILPTGELHPQVGVRDAAFRSSAASLRSLQNTFGGIGAASPARAPLLIATEVRRPGGAAATHGLRREEVAFYQRLSNSRDVPLGQLIEELCVRAGSIEAEDNAAASGPADAKSRKYASSAGNPRAPEQRIHFLHGEFRVRIAATMLPSTTPGCGAATGEEEDARAVKFATGGEPLEVGNSDASSLSRAPTPSEDLDVSAVVAALHTDREAAKTAVAVAETAVQAAESGTLVLVDNKASVESSIWMWNANAASGWQGRARPMSESTYLMSFARYLEAILYHPALQRVGGLEPPGPVRIEADPKLQEQLSEGRHEDARSVAEGVRLLRMFRSGRAVIKVHAQPIRIYELAIDGPVMHGRHKAVGASASTAFVATAAERRRAREERKRSQKDALDAVLEATRLEVQRFFASIKREMTALEDLFVARELDENGKTIRRQKPGDLDASIFADGNDDDDGGQDATAGDTSVKGSSPARSVDSRVTAPRSLSEPLMLLSRLQLSLRTDEFELYDALKAVTVSESVNGIRKAFADRAKSAKNRLAAWIRKHLTKAEQAQLGKWTFEEPEYFNAGRHAFPGSQYLVREDEPLSIIAFSLSSRDFKAELGTWEEPRDRDDDYFGRSVEDHVLRWRSGIIEDSSSQISSASSVISSSPVCDKGHRNLPIAQRDPDTDDVFYEPEPVQTTLKRKKRARETSILSLRLRKVGSTVSSTVSTRRGSRTSMILAEEGIRGAKIDDDDGSSDSSGKTVEDESRRLTEAEGEADVSAGASDTKGPSSGSGGSGREAEAGNSPGTAEGDGPEVQPTPRSSSLMHNATITGRETNTSTISSAATNSTFRAQIVQVSGRPASLASIFSSNRDPDESVSVPGTDAASIVERQTGEDGARSEVSTDKPWMPRIAQLGHGLPGMNQTPRSMRSVSESVARPTRTMDGASLAPSSALPTPSVAAENPHIKHNLVHGNTKISCVSWFAEEFAALRAKWGVEHDFVQSLSRCQPWNTTGGKSKSAFFKTQDERYIGKQLLTVWSVDEKEAFLEFAPAYLRYMMNSVVNDCPTLLVKIAGVYSIKIKDLKTGETKLKMNVMIQENLWAGDGNKSVRFDLKGIKDRKVKLNPQQQQQAAVSSLGGSVSTKVAAGLASNTNTAAASAGVATAAEAVAPTVWWDSDWIEQYKSRALVRESQRDLFCKALQNDTQFLTASNIMDYSLLLGVMEGGGGHGSIGGTGNANANASAASPGANSDDGAERPTFRCRIVDFLGAFTLAKQLESSSKKALKSGPEAKGNVTILPPAEYASRFVTALESYFVGVPCLPALDNEGQGRAASAVTRKDLDPVL